MKRVVVLGLLCGCSGSAATGDAGDSIDAFPLSTGWSTPVEVMLDRPAGTFATDPSFTEDMSRVFYAVTMLGGSEYDLYEAQMMSATVGGARRSVLGRPQVVETSPEVSPDGLTMYFLSYENMMGRVDKMTRTMINKMWGNPTTPAELDTPADERPGNTDRTNTHLVIVRATQLVEYADMNGTWVEQATTSALPMGARDPQLSADGLTLAFAAPDMASSSDLFIAVRASIELPWATVYKLSVVSDPDMPESDPWLANDGKRLYFTRGATIYMSQR